MSSSSANELSRSSSTSKQQRTRMNPGVQAKLLAFQQSRQQLHSNSIHQNASGEEESSTNSSNSSPSLTPIDDYPVRRTSFRLPSDERRGSQDLEQSGELRRKNSQPKTGSTQIYSVHKSVEYINKVKLMAPKSSPPSFKLPQTPENEKKTALKVTNSSSASSNASPTASKVKPKLSLSQRRGLKMDFSSLTNNIETNTPANVENDVVQCKNQFQGNAKGDDLNLKNNKGNNINGNINGTVNGNSNNGNDNGNKNEYNDSNDNINNNTNISNIQSKGNGSGSGNNNGNGEIESPVDRVNSSQFKTITNSNLNSRTSSVNGLNKSMRGMTLSNLQKMRGGNLPERQTQRRKPEMNLNLNNNNNNDSNVNSNSSIQSSKPTGMFASYSKYIDIKSGSLNFSGKASLHSKGIDFSNGSSFRISMDDLEFLEEIGRGNYGVVSKVLHKPTSIIMAMKEVRLELDDSKFRQILMELEVLHSCISNCIVEFYGAFFVEGAVYMCMEFMKGGSIDKVYGDGISEIPLAYITKRVVLGLKELKDEHNIIHRDVKPTNMLVNEAGEVKLCDFGVSGNLVASLARTNIGCQSYMAPERIKHANPDISTYSVQSDIWSLGLSILEIAKGRYPYSPETYNNVFSQLSAIVDGEPPQLPEGSFSSEAHDFVKKCLIKDPNFRPTYAQLLEHEWLQLYQDNLGQKEMATLVAGISGQEKHKDKVMPALHKGRDNA
ncbi:mitogen-activated protein kinase kinase [Martiniozyma asiatica (nom. inval.)]|nr:mitogen-activated protein kinase kinase [Martiniozyma asiatica]